MNFVINYLLLYSLLLQLQKRIGNNSNRFFFLIKFILYNIKLHYKSLENLNQLNETNKKFYFLINIFLNIYVHLFLLKYDKFYCI